MALQAERACTCSFLVGNVAWLTIAAEIAFAWDSVPTIPLVSATHPFGIAVLNYGESTCSKTAVNSQRFKCPQVPVGPVLQNLFFLQRNQLDRIIGEF